MGDALRRGVAGQAQVRNHCRRPTLNSGILVCSHSGAPASPCIIAHATYDTIYREEYTDLSSVPSSRRERKKQALRNAIRDETLALMRTGKVEDITIDAICESADISRKTFYNYYATKHELLFGICVSRLIELSEGVIDEALELHATLQERLRHIMHAQRDHLAGRSQLEHEVARYSIISIGQNLSSGTTLLSVMNDNFLRLFEASRDELQSGLSPEFCAEMTVGMINSITINTLHNPDHDEVARFDELLAFLQASMVKEPVAMKPSQESITTPAR